MTARRTKYYLDKANGKWMGVCSGLADYTGIDVLWIRVSAIVLTIMGGFPWTLVAYFVTAWMAEPKPYGLYEDAEEARFWQGVRANPSRTARDVRSRFRDIDRRISDIEVHYTSSNSRLAREIDSLK